MERMAKLSPGAEVTHDLGVNELGGKAILASGSSMKEGLFADRAKLSAGVEVQSLWANDLNIAVAGDVEEYIDGELDLPLRETPCSLPDLPLCNESAEFELVETDSTLEGELHGRVSIGKGAKLTIDEPGHYRFCELRLANGGELESKHQVTIDIVGNLIVGTESNIVTSGGAPLILRVGGSKLLLGRDARVTAAITAPNAKVKVKSRASLEGCLCAESVKLAAEADMTCTGDDGGSPNGAFLD